MKDVTVVSKTIPANPRSDNYQAGSTIVRTAGGTTIITPGGSGTDVDILKENDNRSFTDTNVLSALRSISEFISKKNDSAVTAIVDYLNGIKIGGIPITGLIKQAAELDAYTDTDLMTAARVIAEIKKRVDEMEDVFLHKNRPDVTEYLLQLLGGIEVEGGISTDILTASGDIAGRNIEATETISGKNITATKKVSAETVVATGAVKGNYVDATENVSGKNILASECVGGKTVTATDTVKGNHVQATETVSGKNVVVSEKVTTLNLLVQALADTYDLNVSHVATLFRTTIKDYISSEQFIPGFTGNGMKLYKALSGDWNLELDNLTVRKAMTVFELIISKIRAVNGGLVISPANGKVKSVLLTNGIYRLEIEDDMMFVADDLVRCQSFSVKSGVKYYWVRITSVSGSYIFINASEFTHSLPAVGDDLVQFGNKTNKLRQGLLYLTAAEDGKPRMSVLDGVNSTDLTGKTKVILGCLDDIVDSDFPADSQPSGYGLYAQNVFLKGMFILRSGKTVESEFNTTNAAVKEAQTVANAAKNAATAAQTTASTAVTNAATANTLLADLASDNKLTATEKQQAKKEWDIIASEKPLNNAAAVKFGIATTSYDTAYNTLNTYITPLLVSLTTTSNITGTAFRTKFKAYYDARTNLLNAISAKAKALADAAQNELDNLQIGGRNLLLNSQVSKSGTSYGLGNWTSTRNFVVGEELTVTIKASTPGTRKFGIWVNSSSLQAATLAKVEDDLHSATFKVPTGTTSKIISIYLIGNQTAGDSWSFEWIKLETGNRRTDWTPAPEDIDNRITTVETNFEIREGQISAKVTEVTTKASQAATSATSASNSASTATTKANAAASSAIAASGSATTAGQKATAAANSATAAATSATNAQKAAESAETVLEEVTTKESSITQTAGQIATKVTEVNKKVTEATTAATTATTKATAAATSATNAKTSETNAGTKATAAANSATAAAGSATNAKSSADSAAAKLTTITQKESSINQTASSITTKVTEVNTKASQAATSATNAANSASTAGTKATNAANAAELATAMSQGKMLYRDPSFKTGNNSILVYNNSGNGMVTVARVSGIAGNPNGSGYCLKITTAGASSPGWGGFCFQTATKANRILIVRFIANIPTGRTLAFATNSIGTGSTNKWLTSTAGTGKWQEYAYKIVCGTSGTFSSTAFFYLTAGTTPTAAAPLVWYLCYATVYDVTDAEIDYIADAAGKYTTKTEHSSSITQLSDKIELKVSKTDFNALGNRVSNAETTITQHTGQIALKAAQSDVTALGNRMSSAEAKITPDAIKLTVKSQTDSIVAAAAKRTAVWVDATALDASKYYPITMALSIAVGTYMISVSRELNTAYGKPSWSTHANGFSVLCRWTTNACGWGNREVKRTILDYTSSYANVVPVGSIGQLTNWSEEYIYVRGGSKYRVVVEGETGVSITLRTSGYTHTSSGYTQSAPLLTAVTVPVPGLNLRPTTETIKSQFTIDTGGISILGKKIALTGMVTFSSLASDAQGKINTAQNTANTANTTANTANSGLNTLKGSLKSLAYLDKVEVAKLGTTVIEGGYLKTTLIKASSIDASKIASNAITAVKIAAGVIDATKINVTSIQAAVVTAAKIAALDINTKKLTVSEGCLVAGFSIGNGRIGSVTTPNGEGGGLSIYDNFFRVGGSSGYAMLGNNVMPASMGGAFNATGRIVNQTVNQGAGWGFDACNTGLYINVNGGTKNFGIDSNAALKAPAFINTKIKSLDFSGTSYTIDFSQSSIFSMRASSNTRVSLPSESSIAKQFSLSSLPSDFGYMCTLFVRTGSSRITLLGVIDNDNNNVNLDMAAGDAVILLITKFPSFHYKLLNRYS